MQFKSVLKPEGSVMAGLAVAGSVYALYNLDLGPVASAQASDANHPALESSRKKAGYTAFTFVSAVGLLTKDANILTLGFASIIAMEIHYRHAIMASPATGTIVPPSEDSYAPAQNVVPLVSQGEAVGY